MPELWAQKLRRRWYWGQLVIADGIICSDSISSTTCSDIHADMAPAVGKFTTEVSPAWPTTNIDRAPFCWFSLAANSPMKQGPESHHQKAQRWSTRTRRTYWQSQDTQNWPYMMDTIMALRSRAGTLFVAGNSRPLPPIANSHSTRSSASKQISC